MPSYHWHPTNQHAQQLQLKCLVLGSAGAGKTSLLRRFNYGTFEGHHPGNNTDEYEQFTRDTMTTATNHWRSGRRNPTSTLGADYYVKKIANPLFDKERSTQYSTSTDDPKSNTQASRLATTNITTAAESHSQLFVQLWDTAGKERLMPQRYPAQYDKKSNFYQFLSIRLSKTSNNNNSNNYEHRYNNWGLILKGGGTTNANDDETSMHNHSVHEQREKLSRHNNNINNNTQLKHGRPLHYHRHNSKKHYSNEPREDALYRNVDACMLVYDST